MQKRRSFLRPVALLLVVVAIDSPRAISADADSHSHGPRLVMIIRHAEKPDETGGEKDPDLSPRGFERAKALARVIPDHFPKPDFLIATKKTKGSNRPVETITPLATALNREIDSQFKTDEVDQVAHALLSDPKYDGKVVLIAWHHEKIPDLAKALGVKDAPDKWNSNVFDRVWEITYDHNAAHWTDVPENALPGDSQ
jgi:phosphohistidine phosphatase SixA